MSYAGLTDATQVSTWATQATWYINPSSGNDGYDGYISPLRTLSEWARRMQLVGKITASSMTVTILSDLNSGDYPVATINVGNCNLIIKGTTPTSIQTGTYTSVVQCNPSTNTAYSITDTALSTSNFWSSHVSNTASTGKRLRTTSGANAGVIIWPAKDLGSKSARVSAPLAPNITEGFFADALGGLTTNDPYMLEKIVATNGMSLFFLTDMNDGTFKGSTAIGQARITFMDLQFPGVDQSLFTTPGTIRINHSSSDYSMQLAFFGCDLGAQGVKGSFYACNCRFNYMELSEGQSIFHAGLGAVQFGGIIFYESASSSSIDFRFLFQGNLGGPGLVIHGGSYNQFGSFGVFDCTHGIDVYTNGLELTQAFSSFEVFGSGNSTYGLLIRPGNIGKFSSGGILKLTGTSGDVSIAGTVKTWAQLPFIVSDIAAGSGTTFTGMVSI